MTSEVHGNSFVATSETQAGRAAGPVPRTVPSGYGRRAQSPRPPGRTSPGPSTGTRGWPMPLSRYFSEVMPGRGRATGSATVTVPVKVRAAAAGDYELHESRASLVTGTARAGQPR